MPEFCTCGTQLVEGSLFCHKCGKPQRDIVEPEIVAPPPPVAPPQVERAARPLTFHNGVAIRIALGVAAIATLLSIIPYLNWLAAGFFAVFFYHRRTGDFLNMESGVRMGWITGVMMFVMTACLLTAFFLLLRAMGGVAAFPAEFRNSVDPRMLEALRTFQSGPAVARSLIPLFVFITLLSMAGGALAAKLVRRPN